MQGKESKLNYEIIASGSSGNCVIVEDMMFDVGVPYSKIRKYLYNIKYLFISHAHSDHINIASLNKLRKEFPRITVIGNYHVAERVYVNEIVGDNTLIRFPDRTIESFACVHDIPCHGFIVEINNKRLIFATDTHSLENAPRGEYDYLFLESNHDENKINTIRDTAIKKYGYDAWEGAIRHLSTQKSKAFYYLNRRGKDSEWIELHKSKRFY